MPSFDSISPFNPLSAIPAEYASAPSLRSNSLGAADTLESVSASLNDWKPERPALTLPNALPLSDYRLLAATDDCRNLGNQILDNLGVRLAAVKTKIKEISAENIQKLKEAAERANSSAWWSILKKIATCLLSALSIVFGAALVASGGGALVGGAMIASGVLSLANFALSETGTWDWVAKQLSNDNEEMRQKLTLILPSAVGIVAGGIGLVGSVYSMTTGAIQFAEKAVYVAQTALALFDGFTTFGKGQADARLLWTQADLAEIQGELTAERTQFDSVMREIEGSLSDFRAVKAKSKKTIQIISKSNIQLVRQA